jgi:Fe-S-cluster-containing hydrogenase component 2
MQCASVCRFFAIDTETIKEKKGQPEITCAKCGECISVCPQKAIDFAYKSSPAGKILGTIFRTGSRIVGAAPEAQKGCQSRTPKSAAGRFVAEILEPRYLFVFMAFTFSLMISNKFVPDALSRIWQAIAGGLR